jgi:hypothetical protein
MERERERERKRKDKDPMKIPPKAGDDHVKKIEGKEKTWCGCCSLWSDHSTKDHRAMIQATGNKKKDKNDDGTAASEAGRFVTTRDCLFSGFILGADFHWADYCLHSG